MNVVGALSCSRLVIPQMIERGSGAILFTGGMLDLISEAYWDLFTGACKREVLYQPAPETSR